MSNILPAADYTKPTIQAEPGDVVRDDRNRLVFVHSKALDGLPDHVRGWRIVAQASALVRGEHRLDPVPTGLPRRSAWLVRSIEFITGRPVELIARCDANTVAAVTACARRALESVRAEAP